MGRIDGNRRCRNFSRRIFGHGPAAFEIEFALVRVSLLLLFFFVSTASAQQAGIPAEASRVQSFLNRVQALCTSQPSRVCVDAGWKFAAAAPQRGLSLSDVGELQRNLKTWFAWHQVHLSPRERASVGFGLLMADGIGAVRLHRAFDANGDGLVSQAELLADVALDNRPLGKVLSDPNSVNRARLARRLKLPPILVGGLFQ